MNADHGLAVTARLIGLLLLLILTATACSRSDTVRPAPEPPPPPVAAEPARYTVQRGDTLYGIARRHGLNFQDLARWNAIAAPYTIYPRQTLVLGPPATMRTAQAPASSKPTPPSSTGSQARTAPLRDGPPSAPPPIQPGKPGTAASPAPTSGGATPAGASRPSAPTAPSGAPNAPASTPAASAGGWRWPTEGTVIRGFVANDPGRQGIKIAGEAGQPVIASRAGQVVYSGAGLVGYGELVIVKHDGGYLTAYGHNRRRLVQEGEQVKAGQTIAELGRSGTDREMLHFEIRVGGKPVDPLPLLPR